jgi:hypothetical protein
MLLTLLLSAQAQSLVDEQVLIFEDKAAARFQTCLELADQHDRWTSWQDACLTSLAWLRPQSASFPKQELRASLEVPRVEPALIPRSGPVTP